MRYGDAPTVIGHFAALPSEMMFVQYMPIEIPHSGTVIPDHLRCFTPLVDAAMSYRDPDVTMSHEHVYLTVKSLYVTAGYVGGRPGWHSDGFGTDDLNYIWCDSQPTEFAVQPFDLGTDCEESMRQMTEQVRSENIRTYGVGTLLRLTASQIHRCPVDVVPGFRTFVKISVSRDRYDLSGNAHNYLLDYDWPMQPRGAGRNHPSSATAHKSR